MARIRTRQQANSTPRYTGIHSSAPLETHAPDTLLADCSLLKSERSPFLPLTLAIFAAGSLLLAGSAAGMEDLKVVSRPVRPFEAGPRARRPRFLFAPPSLQPL